MGTCIAKFVDHQIRKKRIDPSEAEVYEYGYRLLIEKICALILTIVIAVLFHAWLEIIIFCIAFIPIRTFAGGYHAKHSLSCMVLSAGVLIFNILIGRWILTTGFAGYALLLETLLFPVIAWMAPVEHSNRKISESERKYFKKVVLILYAVEVLAELVLMLCGETDLTAFVVLAHVSVAGSLAIGMKWK